MVVLHSGRVSLVEELADELPAEVARELQRDLRRDRAVRLDESVEVGARQRGQLAVLRRARLRGARRAVEQRQFAEQRAGREFGDASRDGIALPADEHAPAQHDVERLALLALVEDDLVLEVAALVQQAVDDAQLARPQRREQEELADLRDPRVFRMVLSKAEHCRRTFAVPGRRPRVGRIVARVRARDESRLRAVRCAAASAIVRAPGGFHAARQSRKLTAVRHVLHDRLGSSPSNRQRRPRGTAVAVAHLAPLPRACAGPGRRRRHGAPDDGRRAALRRAVAPHGGVAAVPRRGRRLRGPAPAPRRRRPPVPQPAAHRRLPAIASTTSLRCSTTATRSRSALWFHDAVYVPGDPVQRTAERGAVPRAVRGRAARCSAGASRASS